MTQQTERIMNAVADYHAGKIKRESLASFVDTVIQETIGRAMRAPNSYPVDIEYDEFDRD